MAKQTKSRRPKKSTGQRNTGTPAALQRALYRRGIAMLDKLEKTMTSPTPREHDMLQAVMMTYVSFFTLGSVECSGRERHTLALMFALEPLSEDEVLRSYAELCLNAAERLTLPGGERRTTA